MEYLAPVSYTHLRAHETVLDLVCRLLLEKKIFLMIRRPPRSTQGYSSAASDVYKRQREDQGDVAGAEGISEKKRGEKWNILHILMETEHNP